MITSQCTSQVQFQIAKFKFRQYQNTTFFRHFAKFNARQIFPLYGSTSKTLIEFGADWINLVYRNWSEMEGFVKW